MMIPSTDPTAVNDATTPAEATGDGQPSALPGKADAGKKKKSTNAEVLQRAEEVLVLRINGAQFHDIRQYASEKQWGVSDRQLARYIEKADELLVERRQRKHGRLRALHIARRETLYAHALQAADYRTALAVLQDEAKLQELYFSEKEMREVGRRLKELERLLEPELKQESAEDPLAAYLNGLPVEDKVRLAKLLKTRGYNPGPVPADPPPPAAN